ncbi:MAG: hypothetical protein GPJ54_12060 [Candidatus Heimdallarchaeota archaeon]|nr:hypothetical protein [Candidatus Heimdallarchaeota archaeon]
MSEEQFLSGYYSKFKGKLILLRKEWFGVNYLLFTPYRIIVALSIIFFAGVLSFFSNSNGFTNLENDIMQKQWDLLDDFAFGLNVAIILVTWYFIINHWTTIHNNGDYGYWITLGVQRDKFFITSVLTFVTSIFFAVLSSFLIITTVGGLDFEPQDLFFLHLIFLSNIILLAGFAWLLTELISNMELGSGIFFVTIGLGNFIFRDNDNLIFKVLYPTFHFANYDLVFNLVLPLIIGLSLLFVSYKLNLKREIEI